MEKTSLSRETTINVRRLRELATALGIPYIEERDGVTVSLVGEKQLLIFRKVSAQMFNILEETQCQLIEIY